MSSKTGRYRRRRIQLLSGFQDNKCFYCGESMILLDPNKTYYDDDAETNEPHVASFDHYLSKKRGGGGCKENIVIAHRQCNSEKGHAASSEFDEKLVALNVLRGFGEHIDTDLIMYRLFPDTFGKDSPALVYLCDLTNSVDGEEGRQLRRKIASRLNAHILLIKSLSVIQSKGIRSESLHAVYRQRLLSTQSLGDDTIDTVMDNVCKTFIKRACG